MKPVRFHPDAKAEMVNAAVYYERQQKDLGKRFLASIQEALTRITISPSLYCAIEANVRRCLTKTFPYGVIFLETPRQIVVIAVMHLRRAPDYWKNRT